MVKTDFLRISIDKLRRVGVIRYWLRGYLSRGTPQTRVRFQIYVKREKPILGSPAVMLVEYVAPINLSFNEHQRLTKHIYVVLRLDYGKAKGCSDEQYYDPVVGRCDSCEELCQGDNIQDTTEECKDKCPNCKSSN